MPDRCDPAVRELALKALKSVIDARTDVFSQEDICRVVDESMRKDVWSALVGTLKAVERDRSGKFRATDPGKRKVANKFPPH